MIIIIKTNDVFSNSEQNELNKIFFLGGCKKTKTKVHESKDIDVHTGQERETNPDHSSETSKKEEEQIEEKVNFIQDIIEYIVPFLCIITVRHEVYTFENEIRKKVFGLSPKKNDTNIHDIECKNNKLNSNENVSLKTTGSNVIFCSDILRFYHYNFTKINTIILVKYSQDKNIENIYEINYDQKCHNLLFGNIQKNVICEYVNNVKAIPKNINTKDAKKIFDYIKEKEKIQKKYNLKIQINPKVDSKNQRRVQCSIPNFQEILKEFITYKSNIEFPNLIRNIDIVKSIISSKREKK